MEATSQEIKLVVFNEYTLGYIHPELPNYVQVLHSSVLKGSPRSGCPLSALDPLLINPSDDVRLASKKDFDDFRVCWSDGYEHGDGIYEYEFKKE